EMNRTRGFWAARFRSKRTRATALAVTVLVGLSSVSGRTQAGPFRSRMSQGASLPAIDRGLRSQDPPREPRGGGSDGGGIVDRTKPAYLSGSVIVKYADHASFDIENIPPTVDAETAAAALRAVPGVEYAQPRYLNHAMQVHPNDPFYSSQWN